MKRAKKVSKKVRDPGFSIEIARKYRDSIDKELKELITDRSGRLGPPDPVEMAFVYMHLTFACELYLKSLLIYSGIEPPATHNLLNIFSCFNLEQQQHFEARFNEYISCFPFSLKSGSKQYQVWYGGDEPIEDSSGGSDFEKRQNSLKLILEDTGDSYNKFRYAYESSSEENKVSTFVVHHVGLDCICRTCHSIAIQVIKGRGEMFARDAPHWLSKKFL